MAYMNQEKKARIAAELKKVVPAGWKYTLSVRNHMTLVMTITSAPVDLMAEVNASHDRGERAYRVGENGYVDVNTYHPHLFFTDSLGTIRSILAALNSGNHDRSDSQSDYFDVGWYVDMNIGRYGKPFVCTAPVKEAA